MKNIIVDGLFQQPLIKEDLWKAENNNIDEFLDI